MTRRTFIGLLMGIPLAARLPASPEPKWLVGVDRAGPGETDRSQIFLVSTPGGGGDRHFYSLYKASFEWPKR